MSIGSLSALLALFVLGSATPKVDLSSPAATIRTYCDARDFDTVKQCFYPDANLEEKSFQNPIWTECKILKVQKTKRINMELGSGLFSKAGDVEVIQEVKMIHPAKGNPKTKFWYLLRNFEGEWKIISNSQIPDKNYPPLP
jgi:hypothetical protein